MKGRARKDTDRLGELPSVADPAVVTALAPHPRRAGRIAIELDGKHLGQLPVDLLPDYRLTTGLELEGEVLLNVLEGMRRTAVLDKALDLLAVRSRSGSELATRLRQRGANATDIGWVIERLTAQGYVDDAGWARQLAEARARGRGASRRAIRDELQRKGISPEVARTVIAEVDAEIGLDEDGAALAIARRRMKSLQGLDLTTRRRRLHAFLARRGYEHDVIDRALRVVLNDTGD